MARWAWFGSSKAITSGASRSTTRRQGTFTSQSHTWPCGPMDKASAYGAGDSRFDPWLGRESTRRSCFTAASPSFFVLFDRFFGLAFVVGVRSDPPNAEGSHFLGLMWLNARSTRCVLVCSRSPWGWLPSMGSLGACQRRLPRHQGARWPGMAKARQDSKKKRLGTQRGL